MAAASKAPPLRLSSWTSRNRGEAGTEVEQQISFQDLERTWINKHNLTTQHDQPTAYRLSSPPVATIMAAGGMPFDMCSFVLKDKNRTTICPGVPTTKDIRVYLSSPAKVNVLQRF